MSDNEKSEDEFARANEKAANKKRAREKILATKTIEKGLLIVHTGKGKGKSTAAFGLVTRAMGNGMRVGVVQFVKGKWEKAETGRKRRYYSITSKGKNQLAKQKQQLKELTVGLNLLFGPAFSPA